MFAMPAMVGHIHIVNIGSSGIFHIGDVFAIRPISYSRAFAGAGSFNVGENISVYNYQNTTTVNDSDVVDQAIIGST
ncbi:spore germination protein gerPA [Bacillus cereus Rock3-44]|nr:spore germination protein gerPA [Bacillus cereus Rock3-44]